MKTESAVKKLLPAILLVPALAVGADRTPDQEFYEEAAQSGLAEVELGKLAQEKARSPEVKAFGAMMVKDHTAANEKLKALAAQKGVKLPTKPGLEHTATKAKLEVLSGETFDKSYVKGMVDDHEDDIEDFEEQVREGKDADAKAFATATLPTLRTHLQHIREIATKMGVDAD